MIEIGKISETPSHKEVEWTIDEFFALSKDQLYSPEFFFAGVAWRVKLYPQILYLYLYRKGSCGSGLTVQYGLGLKRSDGTTHGSECGKIMLEENSETWTFQFAQYYLQRDQLVESKNFLVPWGRLTAFCQLRLMDEAGLKASSQTDPHVEGLSCVEVSSQTEPLVEGANGTELSPPPASSDDKLARDLKKLLFSGEGSDVTLKVKGEELRAHRAILGARSPVFASMFRHQMAESNTGLVSIDDCGANIFIEFLHYVYSGKVNNMSSETVIGLYALADKYQVDDLKAECVYFMKRSLSTETFCDVLTVALRHRDKELLALTTCFFSQKMKKIIRTVHWQVFMQGNVTEANELMIKALGPDEES